MGIELNKVNFCAWHGANFSPQKLTESARILRVTKLMAVRGKVQATLGISYIFLMSRDLS